MKLIIDQSPTHEEVEITIKCGLIDGPLEKLIGQIRMYSFSVAGKKDGRTYQLPLDSIFYFESVENKTFAYQQREVYEAGQTLAELEQYLASTHFVRVSKACILNVSVLESVQALLNGRMEARLLNGEKLVINRHYVAGLKKKLNTLGGGENG